MTGEAGWATQFTPRSGEVLRCAVSIVNALPLPPIFGNSGAQSMSLQRPHSFLGPSARAAATAAVTSIAGTHNRIVTRARAMNRITHNGIMTRSRAVHRTVRCGMVARSNAVQRPMVAVMVIIIIGSEDRPHTTDHEQHHGNN